jgi:hypothetical protein
MTSELFFNLDCIFFNNNKKIKMAEKFGAKGVLLFDDPMRSAPQNSTDKKYPNGPLLPDDGTQRGSVYVNDGDPLTPLYPARGRVKYISVLLSSLTRIDLIPHQFGMGSKRFKIINKICNPYERDFFSFPKIPQSGVSSNKLSQVH